MLKKQNMLLTQALRELENNTATTIELQDEDFRLHDGDIKELAKLLEKNTSVCTLLLAYNRLEKGGARLLATALKINKHLVTLDLSYNDIGSAGAKRLATALCTNRVLQVLRLKNCHIQDAGADALAKMLFVNRSLRKLSLSKQNDGRGADIGPVGAQALARALLKNTSLCKLSLHGNWIGNRGAVAFAETLRVNSTLQRLDLRLCHLSFDGIIPLVDALAKNHRLVQFGLTIKEIHRDALESWMERDSEDKDEEKRQQSLNQVMAVPLALKRRAIELVARNRQLAYVLPQLVRFSRLIRPLRQSNDYTRVAMTLVLRQLAKQELNFLEESSVDVAEIQRNEQRFMAILEYASNRSTLFQQQHLQHHNQRRKTQSLSLVGLFWNSSK